MPKRFLYFLFDDWNVLTHTQDMRTRKQNTSASPECVGRVYHPAVNTHPRYPEWQALNSARSTEKQAQQLARTMLAWSKRQELLCGGVQSESSLVFEEVGGRRFTLFAFLCIPQGHTKFEDFQTI